MASSEKSFNRYRNLISKSKDYIWRNFIGRRYRVGLQTTKNYYVRNIKYSVPPDPYKTIRIKPSEIQHRMHDYKNEIEPLGSNTGLGEIRGGNWDSSKYIENVEKHPRIMFFEERFVQNKSIRETEYYNSLIDKYTKNGKEYEEAKKIVEKRLQKYENLFESIKTKGYQPSNLSSGRDFIKDKKVTHQLEVYTVINRKGEIYLLDGVHRFGIARVLDIEIPSHVLCRHKKWQDIREDFAVGKSNNIIYNEYKNHPDLKDLKI